VEAELIAVVGGARRPHWHTATGEQTEPALRRLASSLEAAGLGVRDVVMVNVSLADMRHYPAFQGAYTEFFRPPYPARTIVATSLRHPSQVIEIEATAIPGGGRPVGFTASPAESPAMLAGEELYIGGQLGVAAGADAEQQTRAAWMRVQALVEEAGMALEDVVRTFNTLTHWRSYAPYNAGYGAFVVAPYPPRATMLGGLSDPRALVQIEAVARRGGRDATVLEANPPSA
jgi:enamine deaminase RidA (YjgF/YER057c/UK114 family)